MSSPTSEWRVYERTMGMKNHPEVRIYLEVLARSDYHASITAKLTGRFATPLKIIDLEE